jgi:hypothetical protein
MKYCFVFGAPRSGTTYLHDALSTLQSTETRIGQIIPIATCHIANQDIPDKVYEALTVSIEREIDVYLSGEYNSRFRALADFWQAPLQMRRFYEVIRTGARPSPEWFVHKEPFLSLAPELVLDSLPDAKIIYIYRDGRDVANSLVESYDVLTDQELTHLRSTEMRLGRPYDERYVPWWVKEGRDEEFIESPPYVRSIWMWTYMVRRCHQYFSDLDSTDQVLRVRYETFMREPEAVGSKILEHLGATSTHAFRRHLDRARTSSIEKHKQRSKGEVRAARRIAGSALETLGYDG